MEGIGFFPDFGYVRGVEAELHDNYLICAFANSAKEFGEFFERFTKGSFQSQIVRWKFW